MVPAASTFRRLASVVALAGVAAGCATGPDPPAGSCHALLTEVERAVNAAGVNDAAAAPVAGFPELRVDRFLASFRDRVGDGPAFAAWVDRLRALDRDARAIEIANLPPRWQSVAALMPEAADCGDRLAREIADSPERRAALRAAATVPDSYRDWQRAVGVYPVTALPIAIGYARWQDANLPYFDMPVAALPVEGRLVSYAPPAAETLDAEAVAAILARSRDNPLDIPEPDAADRERLFATFAPVWQVDVAGEDDRIGMPGWDAAGAVAVDTDAPVTFRRLSHGWWRGRPALQLNYGIWFPSRPRSGPLDLLGGHLDGILWRVTLGDDGLPLVYDSIHHCGCYHLFFPVPPLRAVDRRPANDITETNLAPAQAPVVGDGQRMVVRIAHTSHYLVGLDVVDRPPDGAITYAFAEDDALRSLPHPDGGTRSLFGPDGIVAGTERLERFLLWPMGIASPGAMRQWGTHATAFVGRRHFDDPFLLEEGFLP